MDQASERFGGFGGSGLKDWDSGLGVWMVWALLKVIAGTRAPRVIHARKSRSQKGFRMRDTFKV